MASTITLEAPNGIKCEFIHCNGSTFLSKMSKMLPYGGDIARHHSDVKQMKIRDDDWYLATYPKCGTHWAWEIMCMLQRGSPEHEKVTKETVFLDLKPIASIDERPSPRILNSHMSPTLMPNEIIEKKTKIVHVMRNPKDAFVSMYHHFKAMSRGEEFTRDFQTFLPYVLGTYGIHLHSSFFDYIRAWEAFSEKYPDQIINIYYEDMKEDPVREIKKINEFLGTNRDSKIIEQIAEACDFKNLKKADAEVKVKESLDNKGPKGQGPKLDFMYRKGQVGDWKNHFTVAMNEQMDRWIQQNSYGCKSTFRYTI
ncbi:hypothetical protein ACF0H5_015657 [Mactra antiquata]